MTFGALSLWKKEVQAGIPVQPRVRRGGKRVPRAGPGPIKVQHLLWDHLGMHGARDTEGTMPKEQCIEVVRAMAARPDLAPFLVDNMRPAVVALEV